MYTKKVLGSPFFSYEYNKFYLQKAKLEVDWIYECVYISTDEDPATDRKLCKNIKIRGVSNYYMK